MKCIAPIVLLFVAVTLFEPACLAQRKTASAIDPELAEAIKNAPSASQWPNCDYARLLDTANVTVKADGTVVAEYRETYKLFNERARSQAEVELPFNASYEDIQVVRARTVKKNGDVLPVKGSDIRVSSPYSDYALYDDSKSVSFSMPGIEDDCVIDYTFRKTTKPLLLPGHFWEYWRFSGVEPVGICRYRLTAPTSMPIHWKLHNDDTLKPTETTSPDGSTVTYVWEMKNIKPIAIEPMMPPSHEVTSWLEVTSVGSWQDISKWFWGLAKPQIVPNAALKATVGRLVDGAKTDEERARALYDYAANRVRYVGLEFGISAFKPHAAVQVNEKLYGDCKDKAHLLIAMLGVIGVKAYPVLLMAGERTPAADRLPALSAFNHCIVLAEVGGKDVWLDATAEACAYGDIPDQDRGVDAFVIREGVGEYKRIPTYEAAQNGFEVKTTVDLTESGAAQVETQTTFRGGAAQYWRTLARSLKPDQRNEMIQASAQSYSTGAKLKGFSVPDGADKASPFVVKMSLSAPGLAKRAGSLLVLPVTIGKNSGDDHSPFVKETRQWPIVFDESVLQQSETVVRLPEPYVVEEAPPDVELHGPQLEYKRRCVVAPDGRSLTITWSSTVQAGRVPAADYAKVRAFYQDVDRVSEDQIVLRKKKQG